MTNNRFSKSLRPLLPVLVLLALLVLPSFAADVSVDLTAGRGLVIMSDGTVIDIWGFKTTGAPGDVSIPGPQINLQEGDNLTINLTNNLDAPVSIVIPGQLAVMSPVWVDVADPYGPPTATGSRPAGDLSSRVRSFTAETPAGGVQSYTWNNVRAGTYLYHSGTHPAVQVQMGLYGALTVNTVGGDAYTGISYDNDVVLVYSEIDPLLHNAVEGGTYGSPAYPSTLNYKPEYFLINGESFTASQLPLPGGNINQKVLIRFLNAGLRTHIPTLQGAFMSVIAEDGNAYAYPKEQYSLLLPAGKTMDAVFDPSSPGTYPIYDRSLHLTSGGMMGSGMLVHLQVADAAGAPVAVDDTYSVDEDATLSIAAPGVLGNDTGTGTLTSILVSSTGNGSLTLTSDGSFSYVPDANFSGSDSFGYKVNDGVRDSNNVATVTINLNPVNDAPLAVDDNYDGVVDTTLNVAAPGVLGNDSDVDGDTLTAVTVTGTTNGSLNLNTDGSFSYTPNAGFEGSDSFTYMANDGTTNSNTVTVSLAISAPVNIPPVAVDDAASTVRNTSVVIDLITNDSDADGSIDPTSVVITSSAPNPDGSYTTTRGGTVVNNLNGTVIYIPRRNFRGTDTFTYTVNDDQGATSNEATVRVNVTKN